VKKNPTEWQYPKNIDEAFNFDFSDPTPTEKDNIQKAFDLNDMVISVHAFDRMEERDISFRDVRNCIKIKNVKSKDPKPNNSKDRPAGINYDCKSESGEKIRIKVGWSNRDSKYTVITVSPR